MLMSQEQILSPRVVCEQQSWHLHSCTVSPFGNLFINNFATLRSLSNYDEDHARVTAYDKKSKLIL